MTALHDFIKAAASFYGIPEDQLNDGCTIDASRGDVELVLRIALSSTDIGGIARRMERIAVEQKVDEALAAKLAAVPYPGPAEMRERYNALHPIEKSRFGSFARFVAMGGVLPEAPTFPEPAVMPKVELPAHVWVPRNELTDQQRMLAVGTVEDGSRYAMDPADLTEQQRARLSGVTSDAADFGGMPG